MLVSGHVSNHSETMATSTPRPGLPMGNLTVISVHNTSLLQPSPSHDLEGSCHHWQDAQHTLFQLANLCMAISFLTPSNFGHHVLFLRCLLLVAFLFFLLWAGLFICMADVLAWNAIFFLANAGHIAYLSFVNFPSRFPRNLEDIYAKLFKPLKLTRHEFGNLCRLASLVTLPKGSLYALEGVTPCTERVSILIKGRLKVTYERLFLHYIDCNQFVDSAEFDFSPIDLSAVSDHKSYQVTISATEESLLLTWPATALKTALSADTVLCHIFSQVLGKDICSKLYNMQELLLANPDYMRTLPSRQSSMVNVRSSLVTQDGTNADTLGGMQFLEPTVVFFPPSHSSTVETSV